VSEYRTSAEKDPGDSATLHSQLLAEHRLSWGVRGDNNPDYAKYLGYLTSKELYPDFKPISFRDYLKSVVDRTAQNVYTDDHSVVAKHGAILKSE
jgi:hypothetical protein